MEMPERWSDVTTGFAPSSSLPAWASNNVKSFWQNSWQSASVHKPPSLWQIYNAKATNPTAFGMKSYVADHAQAKCFYLWVMTAIPEAKTMFSGSEIGDVDGDGWKMFIDGWGNPIGFLRWAPGATVTLNAAGAPVAGTGWSDVQINDSAGNNLHHDPFDPNFVEKNAYHLYPLIFAGVLSKVTSGGVTVDDYGIALGNGQVPGDCNVNSASPAAPTPDPFSAPYSGGTLAVGAVLSNGGVPLVHNQHMEQR